MGSVYRYYFTRGIALSEKSNSNDIVVGIPSNTVMMHIFPNLENRVIEILDQQTMVDSIQAQYDAQNQKLKNCVTSLEDKQQKVNDALSSFLTGFSLLPIPLGLPLPPAVDPDIINCINTIADCDEAKISLDEARVNLDILQDQLNTEKQKLADMIQGTVRALAITEI